MLGEGKRKKWTENWTIARQIELFKTPLNRYIMWAVGKKLIPLWSMSGQNLSKANLSWANLSWANLSGANGAIGLQ